MNWLEKIREADALKAAQREQALSLAFDQQRATSPVPPEHLRRCRACGEPTNPTWHEGAAVYVHVCTNPACELSQ